MGDPLLNHLKRKHHLLKQSFLDEHPDLAGERLAEIEQAGDSVDVVKRAKSSSVIGRQAAPGQRGPGPNPGVTSPSGASAGVCDNGSCSCGDCGPACTGSCCDECTMGDELDLRRSMPLPGADALDPEVLEETAANHPDPEVRAGAKQLLADVRKASPLIDQIANRARLSGAPATQPLTATSAAGIGNQDVFPGGTVDDVEHMHVHRHDGEAEKVRPYFHNHPHDHAISHDPDDPNDTENHDSRAHLGDSRHVLALRGFGGWEAKSAGATPADALKAVRADSVKVLGYETERGVSLTAIKERLAENAAAIRHLSMSVELAELRKAARDTTTKSASVNPRVRQLIAEQRELGAITADAGGIATRAAKHHGVPVADLQRAAHSRIRKNAQAIRAIAGGEVDWNGRLVRKGARTDLRKAHQFEVTPELTKVITAAVNKAFENIDARIDALNRRAQPRGRS